LNVLLSFAQFEREVTAERIRDKIAASKAKGMWMGGVPPLGYDVVDHTLVINEEEARRVRHIWRRFVALRSPIDLCRELSRDGLLTKAWVTKQGVRREGRTITKQNLYKALRNPVYIGKIHHKGRIHDGQHEAIIDMALWGEVQAILAEDERQRVSDTWARGAPPALLRGLLYSPTGDRMIPSFTRRRGRCYRYYVAKSSKKLGAGADPVGSVPAEAIESLVLEQVLTALQAPATLQSVWDAVRAQAPDIDQPTVVLAMRNLGQLWRELFPAEQQRIVRLLISRVQLREDGVDLEWLPMGWSTLAGELTPGSIGAELQALEETA
jgi:site-specific DNA recombinase